MRQLAHPDYQRSESSEKGKEKVPAFRLAPDIEQRTILQKVFEEWILDNREEFSLWELLGIANREFQDLLLDLVKSKRRMTEESGGSKVSNRAILMIDAEVDDEMPESH